MSDLISDEGDKTLERELRRTNPYQPGDVVACRELLRVVAHSHLHKGYWWLWFVNGPVAGEKLDPPDLYTNLTYPGDL